MPSVLALLSRLLLAVLLVATPLAHGQSTRTGDGGSMSGMPCHSHESPGAPARERGDCCDGDGPFQCPMVAVTIDAAAASLPAVVVPYAAPDAPIDVVTRERPASLPLRPPIRA